jgi:ribonuclease HII
MPWIIGIDEAGYGPNLGPLVMTSVACRVSGPPDVDLWQVLESVTRREPGAGDDRILIADSKVVHGSSRGLHDLERHTLAALPPWGDAADPTLSRLLEWLCPVYRDELSCEPWYTGKSCLPLLAKSDDLSRAAARFATCCAEKQMVWGLIRSVIVCPQHFNALLDDWGSKGAVLGHGLTELVRCNLTLADESEPLHFLVDKHGGRNTYAAMLQNAVPEGMVVAQEERMVRSMYQVLGLRRPVQFTFQPRADAEHFCVALASMVSKYLREVLMLEFNRFWLEQMPGLKPTAGYPGDAARFFQAIRPVLVRLGLPEAAVWRRK